MPQLVLPPPIRDAVRTTLAYDCGLAWPRPSLLGWPPDRHLALSLVLAIPVWMALGGFAGGRMHAPATWAAWASFVLLQPLIEELVFRGILHGQALRLTALSGQPRRLGPVTLANVLVTIAFVALHMRAQPLAWALAVAVPSLVFGHLRERFASVWPAVGLHAFYNLGFALTAWLVRSWPGPAG
jgi:uncharacterized protein